MSTSVPSREALEETAMGRRVDMATAERFAENVDTTIGRRIRETRNALGWSQQALADLLYMNRATLSRIEAGKRPVSIGEWLRIGAALNVGPSVLLWPLDHEDEQTQQQFREEAQRAIAQRQADEASHIVLERLASGASERIAAALQEWAYEILTSEEDR